MAFTLGGKKEQAQSTPDSPASKSRATYRWKALIPIALAADLLR
jgi:hypothetical protein